ncbi:hypothetical protein [Marinobacter sp. SS21]|uniref:hypothetical protein n=1 Tax=Marinobacter sp. SS21 TaxID=2979460 RepID=UPI00232EF0FC|nr:hypothetical protein [Marinobacter sp. SS21]MDC0663971.1 hypothetical protein [Marinobacter sp. SS21]
MPSMPAQRSWLLDPSRLKLVHQCRRLIHSEFGIKLHLTDERLTEQLASYADRSRSDQLQQIWSRLKAEIPGYHAETEIDEPARRMYRGQAVAEPGQPGASPNQHHGDAATPRRQMIYRGQVVDALGD